MFGRWPFCKTEGTRISSLRVYLVVIVISRLFNLVGKDRLYSIGYAEIELDIHVKVFERGGTTLVAAYTHRPPSLQSTPLLLLPLSSSSYPLINLKKNRRSLYPLCPPPPLIWILPNDQSGTRTRVYASLSEPSAICATAPPSTPLHTFRASAVPISPTSSVHHILTPVVSLSAYPCALRCIILKLSNAHYTNPCVGGPRCGPRGYSPCCPCVDHPWCQYGSPSI
jgi:hypothetical protein